MRVRHGDTPAFALYSRGRHNRGKIRQGFESFPLEHLFPDLKASKRERTEQIASVPIDASTKVFSKFKYDKFTNNRKKVIAKRLGVITR
jgi:hypothetical protein